MNNTTPPHIFKCRVRSPNGPFGKRSLHLSDLNYPRVEANPPHPNNKVEASAHKDVVVHFEPTQPNPGSSFYE
jgi:hypothetical protein